jgi:hypothetical protein
MVLRGYGPQTQGAELNRKLKNKVQGFVPNFENGGTTTLDTQDFTNAITSFVQGIDKLAGFKWQGALDMTLAVSGIDVPAITDQIKTAIGKIISDEINTQLANRGVGDSPFRVGPPGTLNQNPNQ